MSGDLLAFACVLLAFYLVHAVHARLYRAVGHRRAGRFAAYVLATVAFGTSAGLAVALAGGGWRRSRGVLPVYVHTSVPEGLITGVALGLLVGVVLFLRGEHRGGVPMFEDHFAEAPLGPAFPPDYVQNVLDFEPRAPKVECVQMARSMRRLSRRTGEPLPPELAAFVERHDAPRRRSRRSRRRR